MKRLQLAYISILLFVGILMHLTLLYEPRQVIFDEVHFGKFVTAYCCTHERFFDIHPPHAKLLIAGTAYLFGYRGKFDYQYIGEPYNTIPIEAVRLFPALTGILLPLVFFMLLKQLGVSDFTAGFGGLLIVFDNSLLVQTRMISLDGTLLLATFGSLSAFLAAEKRRGAGFIGFSLLAGALAGLAVGTKFTGLAIVVLIGLIMAYQLVKKLSWRAVQQRLVQILVLAVAFITVYAGGWALHFMLLTKPGPGDAWGIPHFEKPVVLSFVRETIKLHKTMLEANYNLTATHPYSSKWFMWPIMRKPVFYWQGSQTATIYFIGNPVVWWGAAFLGLCALCTVFAQPRKFFQGYAWIPWAGFLIALGPMIRIPRALFLYHYLTPLFFCLLIGLVWLDKVPASHRKRVQLVLTGLVMGGWILMLPLTYGFVVPVAWTNLLHWFL